MVQSSRHIQAAPRRPGVTLVSHCATSGCTRTRDGRNARCAACRKAEYRAQRRVAALQPALALRAFHPRTNAELPVSVNALKPALKEHLGKLEVPVTLGELGEEFGVPSHQLSQLGGAIKSIGFANKLKRKTWARGGKKRNHDPVAHAALVEWRAAHDNETVAALAAELGVSARTFAYWLSGKIAVSPRAVARLRGELDLKPAAVCVEPELAVLPRTSLPPSFGALVKLLGDKFSREQLVRAVGNVRRALEEVGATDVEGGLEQWAAYTAGEAYPEAVNSVSTALNS